MTMIDTPLDREVLDALKENPHTARRDLHLVADCGHVTILGVVDTYYEKQMAQEVVARVSGVSGVKNDVAVVWS